MGTVQSYRQLIVWQKAMDMAADIYQATESLPKQELYGLTSQLRRAATSVAANVAEGQGRRSTGEFCHFLGIARGSLYEVETELLLARSLRFMSEADCDTVLELTTEVARLLNGLMNSLEQRTAAGTD